jgi:glycosyltransferase involved in cell wall biosynthesis
MHSLNNKDVVLGIVVPCFNESNLIIDSIKTISSHLKNLILEKKLKAVKFCIVDDGSIDGTWDKLKDISNIEISNISYSAIKFSENFGHQNALIAGMNELYLKTDCIITIDADLEQDFKKITEFVNFYIEGYEIVIGIRNNRKGDRILKKFSSYFFYFISKISGSNIIKNHADYRLLSKKIIGLILKKNEKNMFLRGMISNLGFKKAFVNFDVIVNKERKSRYSFVKMINLAFDSITIIGRAPLRLLSILGSIITIFSIVMILYILAIKFTRSDIIPGWASSVLPIYLIGGLNIFAVGVIGEYIGKIYDQVSGKENYIIEDKIYFDDY